MKDGQVLVEAKETGIQPFDEFEAEIVEFEEMNSKMKFDLATDKGVDECEAYLLLLRKVEIRIDKKRKSKGTDLRRAVTDLNASAKVWHNRVHVMYDVIDEPLAKIKQEKLDAEMDKHEKEQAELKAAEEKREADLQKREAAANAKEAELKEKEDAANLVESNRIAAEEAVAAEKAKAHKEKNDQIARDLQEKNRLAAQEQARQANVEHRKDFNNQALQAIIALTDDPASSLRIVKAIVKGEIPNVTLNY